MSRNRKLDRREFLIEMLHRAALASCAPLLFGYEKARAAGEYRYFIGIMAQTLALLKIQHSANLHGDFFTGYGNWQFGGDGTLSGLNAIRPHVFVPRGLTYRMQPGTEGVGHFQAHGGFLTGYPSRGASSYDMLVGDSNTTAAPSNAKSIDWMIAQSANKTPMAVGYRFKKDFNDAEAPHFFNAISWRDPRNVHYPVFDSKALFNQLQGQARCSTYTSNPAEIQSQIALAKKRKVLMDRVQKEYEKHYKLHRRNSEAYDQYVADFKKQSNQFQADVDRLSGDLSYLSTKPVLCDWSGPSFGDAFPSESSNTEYQRKVRELNTLVALSLKSGLTNAATMSLCLGRNHHYQHYIADRDVGRDGQTRQNILQHAAGLKQYMNSVTSNLVHLVDQLKAQGIFEQTLILVSGEQNDGNTHTANEAPVFVIDGKNSSWNGRNVGSTSGGQTAPETKPYASLLVDIVRKFGISVSSLGSSKNVKGVGTGGVF